MELPEAVLKIGVPGKGKHFQKDFSTDLLGIQTHWEHRFIGNLEKSSVLRYF